MVSKAESVRILITGGFGFVGGRIAQHLVRDQNLSLLLASRSKRDVPAWLSNARAYELNWESESTLEEACDATDVIIHAAGLNAQECTVDPERAFLVNAGYTARLLKIAAQKKVRRFIYLSTAHVYKSPLVGELSEQSSAENSHPYAASHRAAENLSLYFENISTIQPVILRLSNAFGAPAFSDTPCWDLVANDLCRQSIVNKHMHIKTSGLQKRDFIPMSFVCEAVSALIIPKSQSNDTGIFNLSSGNSLTILALASLIQVRCQILFGYSPKLTHSTSDPIVDFGPLQIDNSKITQLLRTYPPAMQEEIDTLLQYCRNHFGSR